jgi:hypothetical protein
VGESRLRDGEPAFPSGSPLLPMSFVLPEGQALGERLRRDFEGRLGGHGTLLDLQNISAGIAMTVSAPAWIRAKSVPVSGSMRSM